MNNWYHDIVTAWCKSMDCKDAENHIACDCEMRDDFICGIEDGAAARDKEWVEWIERTFYPSANWSDFDNEVWKARRKEIGL